jgi:hypothetical protein
MPRTKRARGNTAASKNATERGKRTPRTKTSARAGRAARKWSGPVTKHSNALDLEAAIFTSRSPRRIAESLKHSALASSRRKGSPYQSAMSMLNFYINRAGRNLSAGRKRVLEATKPQLRKAFGRE